MEGGGLPLLVEVDPLLRSHSVRGGEALIGSIRAAHHGERERKPSERRVQGTGYRVRGTGYRVHGTGYRVQGTGRLPDTSRSERAERRVQGTGYGARGTGFSERAERRVWRRGEERKAAVVLGQGLGLLTSES